MKKIYYVLLFIFLFLPVQVSAEELQPKRVLFINQVRGTECCDKGSTTNLQQQIEAFKTHELPATFTIRYDAVIDPEFQKILKELDTKQFELGIFLEITPQLAKDSGVEYRGEIKDWYQAQQVYTIGYSETDRKKLIDTAFKQFFTTFGYYPQTTTGWIIDTSSINYMKEKYGVLVHQLTREQWGTDSYTLYGGPFHYPYLASKNWAIIPRDCSKDSDCRKSSTLIVRQTVADPVRNYGDTHSAFTSQPNDYIRDGKDFSYFEQLLTQTLDQDQNQYDFAVLGLENSMETAFHTEYAKQIQWIADYSRQKPEMKALKTSEFYQEFLEKWATSTISSVKGKDLTSEEHIHAVWLTTSNYRMRLLRHNDEVKITDFRLYNQDLQDPYDLTVASHLGYWIVPFLIDGSRFRNSIHETDSPSGFIQKIELYFSNKFETNQNNQKPYQHVWQFDGTNGVNPTSIQLPHIVDDWSFQPIDQNTLQLSYTTPEQKKVRIVFEDNTFTISSPEIANTIGSKHFPSAKETPFITTTQDKKDTHSIGWMQNEDEKEKYFSLQFNCPTKDECQATPEILTSINWPKISKLYAPYFFPEHSLPPDQKNTVFHIENRYVIAGRSPIHLSIIPQDTFGFSALGDDLVKVYSQPPLNDYIVNSPTLDGEIVIDVVENKVGSYEIEVKYGEITHKETIYFAPNCRENIFYCVRHPIQSLWYFYSSETK